MAHEKRFAKFAKTNFRLHRKNSFPLFAVGLLHDRSALASYSFVFLSRKKISRLSSPIMARSICMSLFLSPVRSLCVLATRSRVFKTSVSISIPRRRILYSYACIPPSHRPIIGVKLFLFPILSNFLSFS